MLFTDLQTHFTISSENQDYVDKPTSYFQISVMMQKHLQLNLLKKGTMKP